MGWFSDVVDVGLGIASAAFGGGGGDDSGGGGGGGFMQAPDPVLNDLMEMPNRQGQGVKKAETTPLPSGTLTAGERVEQLNEEYSEAQEIAESGWEQTYEWMDFLMRNLD